MCTKKQVVEILIELFYRYAMKIIDVASTFQNEFIDITEKIQR